MKRAAGLIVTLLSLLIIQVASQPFPTKKIAPQPPNSVFGEVTCLVCTFTDDIEGRIFFIQQKNRVVIVANITGLPPLSEHAWHIHTYGDAAGDIFNPFDAPHGCPPNVREVGSLGNITTNAAGEWRDCMTSKLIDLNGPFSIAGRVVNIHVGPDECVPGGSIGGPPIASCVIGLCNPENTNVTGICDNQTDGDDDDDDGIDDNGVVENGVVDNGIVENGVIEPVLAEEESIEYIEEPMVYLDDPNWDTSSNDVSSDEVSSNIDLSNDDSSNIDSSNIDSSNDDWDDTDDDALDWDDFDWDSWEVEDLEDEFIEDPIVYL